MRRVLVTGGAGFIGSHVVDAELASGAQVIALDDLSAGQTENLAAAMKSPNCRFVNGSAFDAELVARLLGEVDHVYHFASAVGVEYVAKHPAEAIDRIMRPTRTILDELCRLRDRGRTVRLFLAGSSESYGKNPRALWRETDDLVFGATHKPRWSYGMAKALDEQYALARVRSHDIVAVLGRFFNVVGPRQSGAYGMVLPRFVEAAKNHAPLIVHGDGSQTRCFAHAADVAQIVRSLLHEPAAAGKVVNIGHDVPVSILELAQLVIRTLDSRSAIESVPYAAAFNADFEDVPHRVPDLTLLRSLIGPFAMRSLTEIVREFA